MDLGTVRVGLAVTDELGLIANPLDVVKFKSRKQLLEDIHQYCLDYKVSKIILGLPKTLKGEEHLAAERIRKHFDWFSENSDLEWVLWDERMSTAEAERILLQADVSRSVRKEVRDKLAAQRILQNYIESHPRQEF